jgi:hypothetical protein
MFRKFRKILYFVTAIGITGDENGRKEEPVLDDAWSGGGGFLQNEGN